MPSPIGHLLAGAAISLAADQRHQLSRRWRHVALVGAALAASPDLDLLLPGAHRTITHSFFAVGVVGLGSLAWTYRTGRIAPLLALAWTLSYASHLLTDYFGADYGTPAGLQLFWPWGFEYYKSDWSLFRSTERHDPLSAFAIEMNARALAQELVVIGPMLAFTWLRRRRLERGPGGPSNAPSTG